MRARDIAETKLEPNCKTPYMNIDLPLLTQDFFSFFDSVIISFKSIFIVFEYYLHSDKRI